MAAQFIVRVGGYLCKTFFPSPTLSQNNLSSFKYDYARKSPLLSLTSDLRSRKPAAAILSRLLF